MQIHTFTAQSAAEAVAQIREKLGPTAVVLEVKPVSPSGLDRLFKRQKIEVQACVPDSQTDPVTPSNPQLDLLVEMREQLASLKLRVETLQQPASAPARMVSSAANLPPLETTATWSSPPRFQDHPWKMANLLENTGLLPVAIQHVMEQLQEEHGSEPPGDLAREIQMTRSAFLKIWQTRNSSAPSATARRHVFVGPPGSGKTIALCKWLAQEVLLRSSPCRVWQLNGAGANVSETLGVHCEVLGVPLERVWKPGARAEEWEWFDLPGVNAQDARSLQELAVQIKSLGDCQVHLVLNGAYDTTLLLGQVRSFSSLPVTDLIITHLDEEKRWGKLWNLVIGTNYSLRFMGAGQNVPGEFQPASPEKILARQFVVK